MIKEYLDMQKELTVETDMKVNLVMMLPLLVDVYGFVDTAKTT